MKSRTGVAAGIAVALSLMVAVLRFALDRGSSSYTPVPIDLEALPAPPRLPDATIELELVVGETVVEVTPDPSLRLPDGRSASLRLEPTRVWTSEDLSFEHARACECSSRSSRRVARS